MIFYFWFAIVLTAAYFLLMLLYCYGFLKSSAKKQNVKTDKHINFSIIIPARNEAENIEQCLQSILKNKYPVSAYEIILIDDFSEDETVAKALPLLKGNNKLLQLSDYISPEQRLNAYKKKALEIAIAQANGAFIITTDADCIVPENWLSRINLKLQSDSNIKCLAAPVNFIPFKNNKTSLYYLQSIDFMTMQGITVASNQLSLGNMSNGANFVFSKAAFDAVEGYKNIDKKASGDDMMLMQKISKAFPKSITFLFDKQAIVDTTVQPNWSSFINQRIRWASKADSYPQLKLSFILLLVYLCNLNFLVLAILCLCNVFSVTFLFKLLILKVLSELFLIIPLSKFFNKQKELIFYLILQPIHILYIVSVGFMGMFGSYQWKGRKVQ